jgi:hypothetical protein
MRISLGMLQVFLKVDKMKLVDLGVLLGFYSRMFLSVFCFSSFSWNDEDFLFFRVLFLRLLIKIGD